jgi:hypothetical protein
MIGLSIKSLKSVVNIASVIAQIGFTTFFFAYLLFPSLNFDQLGVKTDLNLNQIQSDVQKAWIGRCFKNELGVACPSNQDIKVGKLSYPNTKFVPAHPNIYYALMTIRTPEHGTAPDDDPKGDRDSCGKYQQRLQEWLFEGGGLYKEAKAIIGDEKLFPQVTEQEKQTIYNAGEGWSNSMQAICKKVMDIVTPSFFDHLAVRRLKTRINQKSGKTYYDDMASLDLGNNEGKEALLTLTCNSQAPADCEVWKNNGRTFTYAIINQNEHNKAVTSCKPC